MVRESRTNRRLTQGDLAKSLGLLQQAVSGWERGASRPESIEIVRSLAALFPERTLDEWLTASGYAERRDIREEYSLPVRPLLTTLPFHMLTYEQFQDFAAALLAEYYPGSKVHQYGVPGDRQLGIDLQVTLADGSVYTIQCKRVRDKFGPEKVRQAIRDHKVDCDLAVILLSKTATAAERDEIVRKRKKKWDLWDSKDIADRIRSIPDINRKLQIVDAFFPAYRKDFLGIDHPTVFEAPNKYFAPLLTRSHIFSHAWTLVGRDKELEAISTALTNTDNSLVLLVGPGGIGKTRVLLAALEEFAARNPSASVLILPGVASPLPRDYDLISSGVGLVVLEDVHDRSDLKAIAHSIAGIRASNGNQLRVIVTSRPYASDRAVSDLATAGLHITADAKINLAGLNVDEAEKVAREILLAKDGPLGAARAIAEMAHDSPLALVVGSHLVATKKIHPRTLNNASEFRQQLLARFRDAISGAIGLASDQPLIRATLEIVALLQPLDVDSKAFSELAAKVVQQPIREIKRSIQQLLESGVLVRKARRLRIVPDLLGDYLVEEVLRREAVTPNSSIEQLVAEADAEQIGRLLVNTAKLDWRLNSSDPGRAPLSNIVWAPLIERCQQGLPDKLLDGVVTAAYFQPEQALNLFDRYAESGTVPPELGKLLRNVAMNTSFLDRALERLWALAKRDNRPENQHSNHPTRILKELAQIELEKPVDFCMQVADFAMRKIAGKDALGMYAILEEGLDAEIQSTESKGLSLNISRYAVRHAAVKELRKSIITFLVRQLDSRNLASGVRAALALSSALRSPPNVDDKVRAEWVREFIDTLLAVGKKIREAKLNSNVLVALEESVRWHIGYGMGAVRDAAREVVQSIPQSLDYRVTLSLADAWGHTRMSAGDEGGWLDRWREEQTSIAKELVVAYSSAGELIEYLQLKIDSIRAAAPRSGFSPGQFLGVTATVDIKVARAFCDAGLSTPGREVFFVGGFLALITKEPEEGVAVAKRAVKGGNPELTQDVAWTLASRQGREDALAAEGELLLELLSHANANVVACAVRGVAKGASSDVSKVFAALMKVDFGRSNGVAATVFQEIVNSEGLLAVSLKEDVMDELFEKLVRVPTIEDFWIEKFLTHVSEKDPVRLVEFLLRRIEKAAVVSDEKLQPMPYLWDEKLPFRARASQDFREATKRLREWMLTAPDHWVVDFWAPKLYAAIAAGFDESIVRDFLRWTENHDRGRYDVVVKLLRDAPSAFVTENVGLVEELFQRAEDIGPDAIRALRSSLFAAAMSGVRHGTPGQPFPEDVARKTKSEEAVARLPAGSPSSEFYLSLVSDADRDIRQKKLDDDAMFEQYE
jgi:transcriptional regulator with XRE-family HTH domain